MNDPINVAFYPGDGWHAYQESMRVALSKHNIHAYAATGFSNESIIEDDKTDIFHFHWIERLWDTDGFWHQLRLIIGVYRFLRLAKKRGKVITWSVHNHYPHENLRVTHRLGLKLFAKMCDAIYVHSHWSKQWVKENLAPVCEPVVVYHGNFKEIFNFDLDVGAVKQLYTSSDVPLIGILGMIRNNRGHERVIKAIRESSLNVKLLIAGKASSEPYLLGLKSLASGDERIIFDIRRLSDKEYQGVASACDMLILSYKNITTSGALLSAWTMGTPVITTPLPYFEELLGVQKESGVVLKNLETQSIVFAIKELLTVPKSVRKKAAKNMANRFDWDSIILPMVESYRKLIN